MLEYTLKNNNMKNRWIDSRFDKVIRITKKNRDWLMVHKDNKTGAGLLDEIINEYKKK